jgi:hypothetical protein
LLEKALYAVSPSASRVAGGQTHPSAKRYKALNPEKLRRRQSKSRTRSTRRRLFDFETFVYHLHFIRVRMRR